MIDSADCIPGQEEEIRQAEARLRTAMLASDVEQLDQLIDDRLLFVGPDGRLYTKQDDLNLHRSGAEQIERLEVKELNVETHGALAATTALARMSGSLNGEHFDGCFRYIRVWAQTPTGWRIVAGSVCIAPN